MRRFGGAVWVSGCHTVCILFLCCLPLDLEKQVLESAVPVLNSVSVCSRTGELREALVPAAESQLRLSVHAACLICLNARSFSSEAQWALSSISPLSYLNTPPHPSK